MSVPESPNTAANEPTKKRVSAFQDQSNIKPHWLRINGAVRHSGISRARIYELIVVGHLETQFQLAAKCNAQIVAAAAFGIVFLLLILAIAIFIPAPTEFQYQVFRITLALAAAGVAAMIPGILDVRIAPAIRAGGAMAVFAVVYFYSPAQLAVREIHLDPPTPSYPYDGTSFNTYPRTTTLRWLPVKNATHYLVEVE